MAKEASSSGTSGAPMPGASRSRKPRTQKPHGEPEAAVNENVTATPVATDADTSHQARPKRRREDLFLGDTELFAFDFGGEATGTVLSPYDEDANQAEAEKQVKSKELAAVTAQLREASGVNRGQRTPLTLEQVCQCATAARRTPLTNFFFFPGPHATKRTPRAPPAASTEELTVGTAPRREAVEMATLTDAQMSFENGLRKYDEGLWRAHKAKKEEDRAKQNRQRQRAGS